ncbi:MAG: hypothetical protein EXR79_11850 [Myxococcales bacterium]|nr:hypothetical protein [Myxococcales bacterium]
MRVSSSGSASCVALSWLLACSTPPGGTGTATGLPGQNEPPGSVALTDGSSPQTDAATAKTDGATAKTDSAASGSDIAAPADAGSPPDSAPGDAGSPPVEVVDWSDQLDPIDQMDPIDAPASADTPASTDTGGSADAGPDVPVLVMPKGCVGKNIGSDGYESLAITAPVQPMIVPAGKATALVFLVHGVKADGTKGNLPAAATWEIAPPTAGTFDATGTLTTDGSVGGEATVYATFKSMCAPAKVQFVVHALHVVAESSPGAGLALQQAVAKDDAAGGPQIVYPPPDAMAPKDFAPITPQWKPPTAVNPNVYSVRFTSDVAQLDIVGTPAAWKLGAGLGVTLPAAAWDKLFSLPAKQWSLRVVAANVVGKVVQQAVASAPQSFFVAHEKAGGAIYYWNTALSAVRVLEPGQTQAKSLATPGGMCPGCHSISPDGSTVAVSFMMGAGMSSMSMALFTAKSGVTPPWLHPDAKAKLASSFTIGATFSPKYWSGTDRRLVVPTSGVAGFFPVPPKLQVVDLMKGTLNALVKGGDAGQQAFPTWSPDGLTVVYASSKDVGNGFAAAQPTALYQVPFNGGAGGQAVKLAGTDTAGVYHYYPAFTPDGQFIAYNRGVQNTQACPQNANQGQNGGPGNADSGTYDNCDAELWATSLNGAAPIRLDKANGPFKTMTNSWPTFGIVKGQYHWLAFSSRREYGFVHGGNPPAPQIWIAAVDGKQLAQGKDGSFAALWLPGQDLKAGCHIARWSDTPRD